MPAADVVVLGEVHDNPRHHANQAAAVAALDPGALVFEMLTPEQAADATPAARQGAERLAAALDWAGGGWPDFRHYYPIFAAAPEATVFGGGVGREALATAMKAGPAAAFGEGAGRFGLDRPLGTEAQAARKAGQKAAHCGALPENMLAGMVAAQRLRDAALARAALRALDATGGAVAVITGNGHARTDRGVPAMLARAAPEVAVLSVGQLEAAPEGGVPFDRWLVTDPAERDDPCAPVETGALARPRAPA